MTNLQQAEKHANQGWWIDRLIKIAKVYGENDLRLEFIKLKHSQLKWGFKPHGMSELAGTFAGLLLNRLMDMKGKHRLCKTQAARLAWGFPCDRVEAYGIMFGRSAAEANDHQVREDAIA